MVHDKDIQNMFYMIKQLWKPRYNIYNLGQSLGRGSCPVAHSSALKKRGFKARALRNFAACNEACVRVRGGELPTCLELCLDAGDSKAPHHESHQYQCLRSSLSKN